VGVSSASVAWGKYIADLDGVLRVLLKELALTRAERKKVEKSDVFADVDQLPSSVARKTGVDHRAFKRPSIARLLLSDWTRDKRRLSRRVHGG